jgi:membrane associated rhomboid family serine protease
LMGLSINHRLYFELYSPNSPKFFLHQIFTYSFSHDDVSHIVFNLVYFCLFIDWKGIYIFLLSVKRHNSFSIL